MNPLNWLTGAYGIWIKLGLAAAAIGGAVWIWHSYTSGLIADGHTAGMAECTATYTERDNKALQAAIAAQTAAEARADRLEQDAAKAQIAATAAYSKGVSDAKRKTDALVAAARAGSLVLRDPGTGGTCPAGGSPVGTAAAVAGPVRSDAAARAVIPEPPARVLSAGATDFLLALTGEADAVVLQLQAAQARIASDLAVCNAP